MSAPLLSVRDLQVTFDTREGTLTAVDGVSLTVEAGETVCIVGESGSGKTVTCEALTRLLPDSATVEGSVQLEGRELTRLPGGELRAVRGGRIAHVFQNPQRALDPVYTVGEQVAETVRLHRDVSRTVARREAVDLLSRVGIPRAERRADDYPHEFSGGMRQRVVVAVALAGDPDLLVADEPTTALDVTIQRQLLALIADLQAERDLGVLFITHDLGVVATVADRVLVLYAGTPMERGPVERVLGDPAHPYTRALLACLPGRGEAMAAIGGSLPDLTDPPAGCRFQGRCPHVVPACREGAPPPLLPADGRQAACVHYGPGGDRSEVER